MTAPIILFVFNRPEHTIQTVQSLQKNKLAYDSDLYVFSDGWRVFSDNPENTKKEKNIVHEVRNYIKTISGFRNITLVESDTNLGLSHSIISGVTEIINKYGSAIVLEDDLITSLHFLDYMNASLRFYENNKQVMQVSGYMFPVEMRSDYDNVLLPFTASWGWGTWKRAWEHFDAKAKGWEKLDHDIKLKKRFDFNGTYPFSEMLKAQMKNEIDSWAIRWYWTVFRAKGLVAFPKSSYVVNIGMDGSGVNCGNDYGWNNGKNFKNDICDLINFNFQTEIFPTETVYPDIKKFFSKIHGCFIDNIQQSVDI